MHWKKRDTMKDIQAEVNAVRRSRKARSRA